MLMQSKSFATRVAIRLWRSALFLNCFTFFSMSLQPCAWIVASGRAEVFILSRRLDVGISRNSSAVAKDEVDAGSLIDTLPLSTVKEAEGRKASSNESDLVSEFSFSWSTSGRSAILVAFALLSCSKAAPCSQRQNRGSLSVSFAFEPLGRGGAFVMVGVVHSRRSTSISSSTQRLCFR